MLTTIFFISNLFLTSASFIPNMNGPNIYDISNPNISSYRKFSTNYSDIHENVEYFDVYSSISSRYGDVYWTMMEPVIYQII